MRKMVKLEITNQSDIQNVFEQLGLNSRGGAARTPDWSETSSDVVRDRRRQRDRREYIVTLSNQAEITPGE